MSKFRHIFLIIFLFFLQSSPSWASEPEMDGWEDFKTSFVDVFIAMTYQHKVKSNWIGAGLAAPSMWYAFEHDDRISDLYRHKKEKKLYNLVSDISIAVNFPIMPIAFYAIGRKNKKNKMMRFSMELFTSTYLAAFETMLLSFVPINKRPNSNVSFWEKSFRGKSSFPSGHVIPFTVLALKTFQYYGPYYAILPAIMAYMTAYQRVQEGKHYLSDVLGGVFLSFFASEGVRYYSNYQGNHPLYKKLFEHEFQISYIRYKDVIGPRVSWTY